MRQIILLAVISCCMYLPANAQSDKKDKPDYKTAIGIRFSPFGVSFKTNSKRGKTSFELMGYFKDGFTASGMYYWNFRINQPGNLKLYVGGGGLAGFKNEAGGGGAVLGIGGIAGADYKFLHLPINLSLDWQPSYQLSKNSDFKPWGGIAVRFAF